MIAASVILVGGLVLAWVLQNFQYAFFGLWIVAWGAVVFVVVMVLVMVQERLKKGLDESMSGVGMAVVTADDYRKALAAWMTPCLWFSVAVMAVALWYAILKENHQVFFFGLILAVGVPVALALVIILHYGTIGLLQKGSGN